VDFDANLVLQGDGVGLFADDLACQHGRCVQQPLDVTHDHSSLPSIGGNNHHCSDLTDREEWSPISEATEKHSTKGKYKTLP
jgi:hypothetical protein